ncbi:hypothetical protein [Nocardia pseudobrasiliensis]|uniref:hypothetical protein n=1 Tax=Nocardia pseudobrasiliensis TaxID=45979 RepID=UPI00082E6539|nr:hypothetical protein [Nocardia pseudobrasiliensis]
MAELEAFGADSVVIQTASEWDVRPRPYQRGDDGRWHGAGIARSGISSRELWDRGGQITVALLSERPITGSLNQIEQISAAAAFYGWRRAAAGATDVELERDGVTVALGYSAVSGNITKAQRRRPDGGVEKAAVVGKFGTVRRWLTEGADQSL